MTDGILHLRVAEPGGPVHYRVRVTEGVLAGRTSPSADEPPDRNVTGGLATDYPGRVTGWRAETFE